MSAQALPLQEKPLSQAERVVDTFVAPSKTFTDILRSTSWWLPFVLMIVATVPYAWAIGQKVGFDSVAEHEIARNPAMQDQFSQLKPAERAVRIHRAAVGYQYSTYCTPVITLIFMALFALVMWATVNFGLGASTRFGQMFALFWYASLPKFLTLLIAFVLLMANVGTESFDFRNPAGTNLGYYLTDAPGWAKNAGSFIDVFGLWSLALLVIGVSVIARKSKGQAAAVVIGWWFLGLLISTGAAMMFG